MLFNVRATAIYFRLRQKKIVHFDTKWKRIDQMNVANSKHENISGKKKQIQSTVNEEQKKNEAHTEPIIAMEMT